MSLPQRHGRSLEADLAGAWLTAAGASLQMPTCRRISAISAGRAQKINLSLINDGLWRHSLKGGSSRYLAAACYPSGKLPLGLVASCRRSLPPLRARQSASLLGPTGKFASSRTPGWSGNGAGMRQGGASGGSHASPVVPVPFPTACAASRAPRSDFMMACEALWRTRRTHV